VLFVVDRLMSQTADENIPSSVGMFQCCTLLRFSFFLLYWRLPFIFISAIALDIPSSTSSCITQDIVFTTIFDYRHKVVIIVYVMQLFIGTYFANCDVFQKFVFFPPLTQFQQQCLQTVLGWGHSTYFFPPFYIRH